VSLATKLILGGIFALVLAICVVGAILALAQSDDSGVQFVGGDEVFDAVDAEANADVVADTGPLVFGDASGGGRPLLLQHLGDDPEAGWIALSAIAPGTESCIVRWDRDEEAFRDCRGTTYPEDGTGLDGYPTDVVDGKVTVDLRVAAATTGA
jgi:hypothetical protein